MASLQSRVTEIISGKRSKKAILAALKAAGVQAEDETEERAAKRTRTKKTEKEKAKDHGEND